MKKWLLAVVLLAAGCGPSENRVREIVREEFSRASQRSEITDAQVMGPYSPAVRVGNFLFVSGQLGLDPESLALAGNDIESQTRQALDNLMTILQKAGYDSSDVVQCNIFLKDINHFQRMNLIYGGYFDEHHYPARTTVEVSNLPRNAVVEVAAIAFKGTQP